MDWAIAPGHTSNTIFRNWQPANCCKHTTYFKVRLRGKISHHGFNKTTFKRLNSLKKYHYNVVGTLVENLKREYTNMFNTCLQTNAPRGHIWKVIIIFVNWNLNVPICSNIYGDCPIQFKWIICHCDTNHHA